MAKKKARARHARARLPVQFVLVADGGTARLLRVGGEGEKKTLAEIAKLDRPDETGTDRKGHLFGSGDDTDETGVVRFAKSIARRVDLERRRAVIEELVLIAEPRFLGVLRTQFTAATARIITRQVAKDLVHSTDARILSTAFASK